MHFTVEVLQLILRGCGAYFANTLRDLESISKLHSLLVISFACMKFFGCVWCNCWGVCFFESLGMENTNQPYLSFLLCLCWNDHLFFGWLINLNSLNHNERLPWGVNSALILIKIKLYLSWIKMVAIFGFGSAIWVECFITLFSIRAAFSTITIKQSWWCFFMLNLRGCEFQLLSDGDGGLQQASLMILQITTDLLTVWWCWGCSCKVLRLLFSNGVSSMFNSLSVIAANFWELVLSKLVADMAVGWGFISSSFSCSFSSVWSPSPPVGLSWVYACCWVAYPTEVEFYGCEWESFITWCCSLWDVIIEFPNSPTSPR